MSDKDSLTNPHLRSGHTGDQDSGQPRSGPPVRTRPLVAEQNRGKRAPEEGSGVVVGSGAGAGGGGGDEDFDSDPQGGGGSLSQRPEDDHPKTGADAPIGGSR